MKTNTNQKQGETKMETQNTQTPTIGMTATISYYSDVHCVDIIAVSPSGKTLTLRERMAILVNPPKMKAGGFAGVITEKAVWRTEIDPNGEITTAKMRKNGQFKQVGSSGLVTIGADNYYYDYGF